MNEFLNVCFGHYFIIWSSVRSFKRGMVTVGKEQFCGKRFTIKKQMITAGLNINTTKLRCKRNKTFWVINFILPQKSLQFNVLTLYMYMTMAMAMAMTMFGCFKWKREAKILAIVWWYSGLLALRLSVSWSAILMEYQVKRSKHQTD